METSNNSKTEWMISMAFDLKMSALSIHVKSNFFDELHLRSVDRGPPLAIAVCFLSKDQ